MEEYVYSAVTNYFETLKKLGYCSYTTVRSLIVLLFYYHLLYEDYRGYVSCEDYKLIEKALNCMFGTNCLIPYPDYLKMGKLKLGAIAEIAQRVKNLEDTDVLKLMHNPEEQEIETDVMIVSGEEE